MDIIKVTDFIKPELLIVAVVLYFAGNAVKGSRTINDRYIPLLNGGLGITICMIWVLSTCKCTCRQEIFLAVFTAITQGILAAGLSTYVNQIFKQIKK